MVRAGRLSCPTGDGVIAVCGDDRFSPCPFELVVWNPATSQLDRQPIPNQEPQSVRQNRFGPRRPEPCKQKDARATCGISPLCGGDSCWLVTAGT